MESEDFEFEEFLITESIGLSFRGCNFVMALLGALRAVWRWRRCRAL